MPRFLRNVGTIALIFCLFLAFATSAEAAKQYRWKFATQAPKGMGYANMVQEVLLPAMDEATDDTLAWKIYYGGVMGNDDDYVSKMAIGQLQGGGLTLVGTNLISPEFSVLALPFLFNGFEEVDYVRGPMYGSFDFFFKQRGFKLLMWVDQDFDLFYSTEWKFNKMSDWSRAKILSWSGPIEEAWMSALGANPIPLGIVEAPAAIRTGVANTNITTGIWQVGTQIYTTTKYVNLLRIRYSPAALVVTKKAWDSLPGVYQNSIMEKRAELEDSFNAGTRKDAQLCLEGMIKYGVEPIMPPPEVAAEIKRRTMTVWDDFTGKLWPRSLLQELQTHLDWYRSGGKEEMEQERMMARAEAPIRSVVEETLVVAEVEPPAAPEPVVVAEAEVVETAAETAEAASETMAEEAAPVTEKVTATVKSEEVVVNPKEPVILVAPPPSVVAQVNAEKVEVSTSALEKAYPMPASQKKKAAAKKTYQSTWWKHFQRIKAVQTKLQELGLYNMKIDGDLGPGTRKGILEYQQMNGLPQTGLIDQPLLEKMGID